MKSVLISIQPKWCELIASGKKTIEVRKTRPKFETPFKVYIYCTKSTDRLLYFSCNDKVLRTTKSKYIHSIERTCKIFSGKVIGEFVCEKTTTLTHVGTMLSREVDLVIKNSDESYSQIIDEWISKTCLSLKELEHYANGRNLYAWHISDLKIYDKSKELSEFRKPCDKDFDCFLCDKSGYAPDMRIDCFNMLTRPPQSWCSVEDLKGGAE